MELMPQRGNRLGRRMTAVAIGVIAALATAAQASAGTLDQQQTSSNAKSPLYSNNSLAQTFTAGISGALDQADLKLSKVNNPLIPVTVEIRDTSAGKPGTTVLATGAIPTSAIGFSGGTFGTFVPVAFPTPATVTAGTQYALVAWSPTPNTDPDYVSWAFQEADLYSGGAVYFSADPVPPGGNWIGGSDNEFAFKTYVVPAPVTTPPVNPAGNIRQRKCKKKHKRAAAEIAKKKCKKKHG